MLSTIIITYNNADKIKRCLESVKWTDEIIIVDAKSSDQTLAIAKKYTNQIFIRPWDNSYANQRNFALPYAQGDWILQIDPDERIPEKLKNEIQTILLNPEKEYYWIPFLTYFLKKPLYHGLVYPSPHLRLFKNNGSHYIRDVHEQIANKNNQIIRQNYSQAGFLKNHFIHFSFDTVNHYFKKFVRYTEIDALEMIKEQKDRFGRKIKVNLKNPWNLFWFFTYRPIRFFISRFFRHQGYKDNIHGFIYALFSAFYEVVTRVKYWQFQMKNGKRKM